MNYLLTILIVIFLIVVAIISWLLALIFFGNKFKFLASIKSLTFKKITKKPIAKEEVIPEKEEVIPEKEEKTQEFINYSSDGLVVKFSQDFKQKIEEIFSKEIEIAIKNFLDKINQTSGEILSSYQEQLRNIEQEHRKIFASLAETTQKENERIKAELNALLQQELSWYKEESEKLKASLKDEFKKEAFEWLKPIQESLKERMSKTEEEIAAYKISKLRELDRKIYEILNEVVLKVLGRMIDISSHEKFIMEALEKAKEEKLFEEQ